MSLGQLALHQRQLPGTSRKLAQLDEFGRISSGILIRPLQATRKEILAASMRSTKAVEEYFAG